MTRQQFKKFVRSTKGLIFAVEFVKRTTGELRLMVARTGVRSHLRGGEKSYNAASKNLVTVFDMNKVGYRSIPVDGVLRVKVHGRWVAVGEKR